MIIAIHLKTESGDGYLFLEEVDTYSEMLDEVELELGGELRYVYEYDIEVIDGSHDKMRDYLQERIVDLQIGEEDV